MSDIHWDPNETLHWELEKKYPHLIKGIDSIHWKTRGCLSKERKKPFIIAFTGASSCGKSYLAKLLAQILSEKVPVSYFSQDNYYRNFKEEYSSKVSLEEFYNMINFDDPNHIRFDKLHHELAYIKTSQIGDKFYIPKITFGTDVEFPFIEEMAIEIDVNPIIITEGVYALTDSRINSLYDMKIYVDMEDDARKRIWEDRNKKEGRHYTEHTWLTTIDASTEYIEPTRKFADLILDNTMLPSDIPDLFRTLFDI